MGKLNEKIKIDFGPNGAGLYAKAKIERDENLLFIPKEKLISVENAISDEFSVKNYLQGSQFKGGHFDCDEILALFFVIEGKIVRFI